MEEKSWADEQKELREEEKIIRNREEEKRSRIFREKEEEIRKSKKFKEQEEERKLRESIAREGTKGAFSEMSSRAKFAGILGWITILGWFLVVQNYTVVGDMIIVGYKVETILLFCGITCLMIGYLPKIRGGLAISFGAFILIGTALSPDGLDLQHTPIGNWILGIVPIITGVGIIYLFGIE